MGREEKDAGEGNRRETKIQNYLAFYSSLSLETRVSASLLLLSVPNNTPASIHRNNSSPACQAQGRGGRRWGHGPRSPFMTLIGDPSAPTIPPTSLVIAAETAASSH